MRPEYKLTMKRQKCRTISEMIHHAEQYEEYVRARNTYRPPPVPSLALVPETAYYAKKKFDKSHEASIFSENGVTKTKPAQGANEMGYIIHGEANYTQRRATETKIIKPNVQKEKRELNATFQTPVYTVRRIRDDSICLNCQKRKKGATRYSNSRLQLPDGKRTVDSDEKGSPESQPKKLKTTPKDWQSWLRTTANFSVSVQSSRNMDSRPHIEIEIYGSTFSALIDTGATVSMVGKRLAEHFRKNWNVPFKRPMQIRMADDSHTLLEEYYTFEGLICYRDTIHTFGGA
ncbi:hypothetical protein J6590_091511 [Homalodisca vitripennis]|nr:hypothetical protein J6590_091511 [Homalodisca vitripennis]